MIFQNKRNTALENSKGTILRTSNAWAFDTTGSQWVNLTNLGLGIRFSSASYVYIDFADGTGLHRYDSINGFISFDGSAGGPNNTQAAYVYKDGKPATYKRTVRYIVPEKSKIIAVTINAQPANVPGQVLRVGFSELFNLQTLQIQGSLLGGLDESYLLNRSIRMILFNNAFSAGTKYDGQIPAEMLTADKPYTTFNYSGSPLGGKSFADSNLNKLVNLKDTLTSLTLSATSLGDTNGTDGALPANISQLSKVTQFTLIRNNYSVPPPQINTLPNLSNLSVGGTSLTGWGDLSGCVNVTFLTMDECRNAPASMPAWVPKLTKLRYLRFSTFSKGGGIAGDDPARLGALIASIYNHWNANAPKTGANNIQYRGVQLVFAAPEGLTVSSAPGGTYQQPDGYVQGSRNGSPASAREMLWVLTNQYNCILTYNNT